MHSYARPSALEDALRLINSGGQRLLAGGTDMYPGSGSQLAGNLVDLTGVAALRGISLGAGLRIGGCSTWTDIANADLPGALTALQMAARAVGGRQVQNVGTLAGNLCNASPAADGVPPLLVCDAVVNLASVRGQRQVTLADFITGPRQTVLAADEVLVAVDIPASGLLGRSVFLKLGARAYLVISIAMVAVRLVTDGNRVGEISVAVGACSGVAQRLPDVERALIGAELRHAAGLVRAADVMASLKSIADVRSSAEYRAEAATELVARAVAQVAA